MNDMHNFSDAKQNAINEMRRMNRQARSYASYEQNSSHKINNSHSKAPTGNTVLPMSQDDMLIMGLILILSQENSDNLLLLALAYVLMG